MKKLLCCILAICLLFPIAVSAAAEDGTQTARPSVNGRLRGVVTSIQVSRLGGSRTHTVEILDFYTSRLEYWQLLYDRIPTLPLSLRKDMGVLPHLWQNIAHRVARTTK